MMHQIRPVLWEMHEVCMSHTMFSIFRVLLS